MKLKFTTTILIQTGYRGYPGIFDQIKVQGFQQAPTADKMSWLLVSRKKKQLVWIML